ncbi:YrdB family protein [Streptomyces sp. H10-C2]|uniref:YrdB family protein n=1 Tax=unclassified Streptomyces TaxID=2593676 RepID=UPI0024BB1CC0|nr:MULTISPECIES: YrdB family protein [unclassified Streptomyces]MDJ0347512.1 YrdB family protein [Streptomyces sp. PH10-H1]MDJ0375606.1 YrdB family protein [Streptomyces sp. H10-C2]
MSAVSGVLAFLLEIGVYAVAGWWGFTRRVPLVLRLLLASGLVILFALVWGLFGAPSAAHPLHGAARAALELCWFGAGTAAWAATKGRRAALWFAGAWLLSTALVLAFT